jgi:ATP adenylyltransferase
MAEFNRNLWAPWRSEYLRSLNTGRETECFLCSYWADATADVGNLVVWRTESALVVMNRFPYAAGHLLVAPAGHAADFLMLNDGQLLELSRNIRAAVSILQATLKPQGFNVGFNIGQCAGAGLPGHLHAHVVPRWSGDVNSMSVLSDIRVISESLDAMYVRLADAACAHGLRRIAT